jgi:hypothetical protein
MARVHWYEAHGIRYVLCVKNRGYAASLERRKIYRRLDDIRASRDGQSN